jgi:phosphatidylethanolamine/phosphatidyl-N-methylethanolamine N-methyltransferase
MKGKNGKPVRAKVYSEPVVAVYDREHDRVVHRGHFAGEREPLGKTIASYWRFMLAGVINCVQTGAVVPSQRFLVSRMIAPVPPDYQGQIVELGSGTGALTLRLAARCPQARILACEINPVLAHDFESRLAGSEFGSRVDVVAESAECILSRLRRDGPQRPDFIISGIPLGNLDRESALALIRSIHRTLAFGGLYIQFQHSIVDRKKIKNTFSKLHTVPVFLNFPPAVIYYARK